MFISKFWTLLITLVATIMLGVILLARDVINRERVENATAILYKEVTKADVALKLHARKRLDILLKVAVDPEVRRSLAQASAKPDSRDAIRDKLLAAMRKANDDLNDFKADLLMAIDVRGTVVCQAGAKEREHGHNFAGFPAVDGALRGYVRDDIWKLDKEVFLVAARPVIHEGRYVGALVHLMKVSDKLATEISPTVQFALFSNLMMVAVGAPRIEGYRVADGTFIADPIGEVLASESYKKRGYSEVRRLSTGQGEFMAVYAKIRGEAAANGVGFALTYPLDLMTSPKDIYDKASTQDIQELPRLWLILGLILITAVAWVLIYFEGQRPISKLLVAVVELTKSDPKDRMNVYRFRRKIRKIAEAINKAIDYKLKSVLEDTESSSKSIDSILGNPEEDRLSSAAFKFEEPTASDIPPPPPPSGDNAPEPDTVSKNLQSAIADTLGKASNGTASPPPPRKKEGGGPPKVPGKTSSPGPKENGKDDAPKDEEAYFHQIYEKFVALKKELGESVEQLTYERFKGTLVKNRDTLVARYKCSSVKFQVYEKDGKASLKATPVKD